MEGSLGGVAVVCARQCPDTVQEGDAEVVALTGPSDARKTRPVVQTAADDPFLPAEVSDRRCDRLGASDRPEQRLGRSTAQQDGGGLALPPACRIAPALPAILSTV